MVAKRIIVRGIVQGVGYRFFAERRAGQLGVKGWVKNLPDGTVEVVAVAEESVLQRFIQDLEKGPPSARVTGIEIEDYNLLDEVSGFTIKF